MILRFLFFAFLFYLGYKLVFNFIIPIYRTTRQVKRGFREMHQRMQEAQGGQQQQPSPENNSGKNSVGEYIDFEEVKD
jgi:hypothetical protein